MSASRAMRRLFLVRHLPWTVGQRDFYEYFSSFGPVVHHNVIFDKTTGMSKKYGFIQFGNEDSVRAVFKQHTHVIDGSQVHIEEYNTNHNNNNNESRNSGRRINL